MVDFVILRVAPSETKIPAVTLLHAVEPGPETVNPEILIIDPFVISIILAAPKISFESEDGACMIVVPSPAPLICKDFEIKICSVYVPEDICIVSPACAALTAACIEE